MSREFILGEFNIKFENDFINYNDIRKKFEELSLEAYDEFTEFYEENCKNIEDVHNKALDIGYSCISKELDTAIEILVNNDLMYIDKNSFIDKYYGKYISWEDEFDAVDSKYREIVMTSEEEKAYREERKDSRGRWQGGGFGVGGAISGAMKAGAMNMTTGAAHKVFNSVGNMITTANANSAKDKLFKDESTLDDLAIGVMANVFVIHYAVIDALRDNNVSSIGMYPSNEDEVKAKSLLNNLNKGLIPSEKRKDIIEEIIYKNPYNKDIYLYLLKNYGDKDNGLTEITTFLSADINDDKENILEEYYDDLPKDTEEATLNSIEKLKEFAQSLHMDNVDEYLDKFNEILVKHDINIRTVDGVLFETREEAAIANEEYEEIIAIKEKIVTYTEKSITAAIEELNSKEYKTSLKEKHLEELNKKLVETIRLEEQTFLNDKYAVNSINTEDEADIKISELEKMTLRNMDILEKRLIEIKEKRNIIIEEADRKYLDEYFSTVVILNPLDLERAIENISNIELRTEKVKREKIDYIRSRGEKIIKKHNELLQRALKYEVRMNTVKVEKVVEKKGFFGFISKTIEKGGNFIDGIQEKREKEAWDFITNNGERAIESITNR